MAKIFVGIIGERNSGKSTIIRSITGCQSKSYKGYIEDFKSRKKIYVIASSPQERPMDKTEFLQVLESVTNDNKCIGIVIALQPSNPYVRISIETIYDEVNNTKRFKSHAFVIDPAWQNDTGGNIFRAVSGRLRQVRPIQIDGNVFAYLNAREIATVTKLFDA